MKNFLSSILLILVFNLAVFPQSIPQPMSPPRLVNDFAGILNGKEVDALEDSLVLFDRTTSTQIAVVTIKDLEGYSSSDYALEILRKWGVGRKNRNNGIVVLIKPRNEFGRGDVFIAVGSGLEGVLNDAKAGRIIDTFMLEDVKRGDYLSAAINGTAALRAVTRGEYIMDYPEEGTSGPEDLVIALIVVILIVLIISRGHGGHGGSVIPPIIFFGRGGGNRFGGGDFGGFGGFGGGSGSGGGAGRSF